MSKSNHLSGQYLNGSLSMGGNLASERYKNKAALPNQHDRDAEFFGKVSKNFSRPNDRPRGIFNNAATGIAEGLEYAAKSNSTAERKGDYDKYDKVMDYFQEVNNSAMERNQWHEERAMEMEKIKPFATAGLEISYSGMDYDTGNQRMRNIMEQAKLDNPNIKGDYVGYVPNSPIVNMRTPDGNITAISLSQYTGEDVVKRVQENYMSLQKQDSVRDSLDVDKYKAGIPTERYGSNSSSGDSYGSIPIKSLGGKGMAPFMQTINSEINLSKDIPVILHQISEAEKIIADNPSVGNWWNNYQYSGDNSKSALMTGSSRQAYEKLDKIASRVAEAFIRAKGGQISDSERETIKQGLFKVTNSPEANQYNINSIKQELMIAKERGDFAAKELGKGYIATAGSFEEYRKGNKKSSSVVTILDPETNQTQQIDESHLDAAIAGGWERVD